MMRILVACVALTPISSLAFAQAAPHAVPVSSEAGAPAPVDPNLPAVAPTGSGLPVITPLDCCTIPALTPVRIEILATINSKLNRIGEHFPIRLATPIPLPDGREVPAGTPGSGDVVQAAKSGFAGKPGELILAVRYLDYQGTRIPLRSLRFAPSRGDDRVGTATALSIAGGVAGSMVAMFINGGEVNIPAGTIAYAKTSAPVLIAAPAGTQISSQQEGSLKP